MSQLNFFNQWEPYAYKQHEENDNTCSKYRQVNRQGTIASNEAQNLQSIISLHDQ